MPEEKQKKSKSDSLHVEIVRANWDRLKQRIESYNDNPDRLTPPIKPAHVINEALVAYLKKNKRS